MKSWSIAAAYAKGAVMSDQDWREYLALSFDLTIRDSSGKDKRPPKAAFDGFQLHNHSDRRLRINIKLEQATGDRWAERKTPIEAGAKLEIWFSYEITFPNRRSVEAGIVFEATDYVDRFAIEVMNDQGKWNNVYRLTKPALVSDVFDAEVADLLERRKALRRKEQERVVREREEKEKEKADQQARFRGCMWGLVGLAVVVVAAVAGLASR